MTAKIIPKKSSVASNPPTALDLDIGEIAINLADAKLYSKNGSSQIIELGGGGMSSEALTSTGGAVDIDVSTADVFSFTAEDTAHTFSFTNAPATAKFYLRLTGAEISQNYLISTGSYDSVSLDVSVEAYPFSVMFNPAGTRLLLTGNSYNGVHQYDLSTGFDLTTAVYDSYFSVGSQTTSPHFSTFSPDGTKMYVGSASGDTIYQYSVPNAFDVLDDAAYASKSFFVGGEDSLPRSISLKPDGTKLYVLGESSDKIYQYSLSTPFDISTASYDSVSHTLSTGLQGHRFNSDGTRLYVMYDSGSNLVRQYSLSTGYDLTTIVDDSIAFATSSQTGSPRDIAFNADGSKLFVLGADTTESIYQYSINSTSTAVLTYPASVKWAGGSAPGAPADGETDILEFITDDGGATWYGSLVMENVQ